MPSRLLALQITGVTDETLLDFFVRGLCRDVAAEVRYRQPPNLAQAIALAVNVDQVRAYSRKQRYRENVPEGERTLAAADDACLQPVELGSMHGGYVELYAMRRTMHRPSHAHSAAPPPQLPLRSVQSSSSPQPDGMRPSISQPLGSQPRGSRGVQCWNCGLQGHFPELVQSAMQCAWSIVVVSATVDG
jgi:hypothetical protein